jgi:hypothetical protein
MLSLGVDFGQSRDATVIIAVESYRLEPDINDVIAATTPREALRGRFKGRAETHYTLVHIEKLPRGTSFPQQAAMIVRTAMALGDEEKPRLLVDETGLGKPMLDLLRRDCPFPVRGAVIGSGNEVTRRGRDLTIPKQELVSNLEAVLSTRRLHSVPDLPYASELDEQLRAFSYELSDSGRPKFAGRKSHDDFVSALMLALFGARSGGTIGADFAAFMERDIARRRGYLDEVYR